MEFDIIDLTEEETEMLTTIQLKLLRTAQQNKNELYHEMQAELETYRLMCKTNNVYLSSLYEDKQVELQAEFDYQVAILKEQLLFNMSLNEPTSDDELGGSGSDDSGYIVDRKVYNRQGLLPRHRGRVRKAGTVRRRRNGAGIPRRLLHFAVQLSFNFHLIVLFIRLFFCALYGAARQCLPCRPFLNDENLLCGRIFVSCVISTE